MVQARASRAAAADDSADRTQMAKAEAVPSPLSPPFAVCVVGSFIIAAALMTMVRSHPSSTVRFDQTASQYREAVALDAASAATPPRARWRGGGRSTSMRERGARCRLSAAACRSRSVWP